MKYVALYGRRAVGLGRGRPGGGGQRQEGRRAGIIHDNTLGTAAKGPPDYDGALAGGCIDNVGPTHPTHLEMRLFEGEKSCSGVSRWPPKLLFAYCMGKYGFVEGTQLGHHTALSA